MSKAIISLILNNLTAIAFTIRMLDEKFNNKFEKYTIIAMSVSLIINVLYIGYIIITLSLNRTKKLLELKILRKHIRKN